MLVKAGASTVPAWRYQSSLQIRPSQAMAICVHGKLLMQEQYLNGIDANTVIYRVFPFWRALQLFQNDELVLVQPQLWDDPFENLILGGVVRTASGDADMVSIRDGWYGQCWTTTPESDAMWRIYSGDKTGVRLSTTVGKLFKAVCPSPDDWTRLQFFIGKVEYKTEQELSDWIATLSLSNLTAGAQAHGLAKTLLVKREAFTHEREVRVLFNDVHETIKGSVAVFPFVSGSVVDDVMVDPRLDPSMVKTISTAFKSAGYKGTIHQSQLYRPPAVSIPI